jgi:hypothetical protein
MTPSSGSDGEILRPHLSVPFPNIPETWTDPITGLKIPKGVMKNLGYRSDLLEEAEDDTLLQTDLLAACRESILYFINTFCFTYHQFDVENTGTRHMATEADVPFITWEVQDELLNLFVKHLYDLDIKDRDILVNKSRDMGASWICTAFMHWLWLFKSDSQLLELSRTEPYVDQAGNMKALFQKHDYINQWLPDWMMPPDCLPGQKNRTKMHLKNPWNGSCIDGESTTKHAASGDRRLVILLDEFSKVEHGREMRSATRDAGLMRIVNSTVAGPGTEYSKWKNSGQIKVFSLMWWDHPDKGRGRFTTQDPLTGAWKIRSPWYDNEQLIRSPQEMAREIDAEDVDSGNLFFTSANIDKHLALFAHEPKTRHEVDFVKGIANDSIKDLIRKHELKSVMERRNANGPLKIWTNLINGRLDQSRSYIFGIDLGRGQGASNSVISIKCKETKMKVGEWADANTPPYELARIAVALAIWVGGRTKLPFMKWENNGPGWDFGRLLVRKWSYPYYYRAHRVGGVQDKKTRLYGWQSGRREKEELLREYDRVLAHGGYVNPCRQALEEARQYILFPDGGIGPASLVEEDASARKTHGDRVIADALTIDETDSPSGKRAEIEIPKNCPAWRKKQLDTKRKNDKRKLWKRFDFRM